MSLWGPPQPDTAIDLVGVLKRPTFSPFLLAAAVNTEDFCVPQRYGDSSSAAGRQAGRTAANSSSGTLIPLNSHLAYLQIVSGPWGGQLSPQECPFPLDTSCKSQVVLV